MIHWFDLFVVFFLLASAIWSYFRGFSKEVFSILSIVAGWFVASTYYVKFQYLFEILTPDKAVREMLSFVLLFFVTILLVVIVGIFVRKGLRIHHAISAADRVAGALMGLLKGSIILAILAYPLGLIPGLSDEFTKGSKTAPALIGLSGALLEKFAPSLSISIKKSAGNSRSYKDGLDALKKYKKQMEKLGTTLKKTTGKLVNKLTGEEETEKKPANRVEKSDESADNINESDKQELEALIKKADEKK